MKKTSRIKYPQLFQGQNKHKHYFEGWYFKHVDSEQNNVFAIIPGINYEDDAWCAFIQVIIGPTQKSYYIDYDYGSFAWSDSPFGIQIGNSTFSLDGINIDINTEDLSLRGKIQYGQLTSIDSTPFCPNIMGFFAYIRSMQCNHGVISLHHSIRGQIACDGVAISYDGGNGYIEKDWGTSFPREYCWVQCSSFDSSPVSLFLSIANIPFYAASFRGHICILMVGDRQYRFATYNGSKIKQVVAKDNTLHVTLSRKNLRLEVTAQIHDSMVLKAPKNGIMQDNIKETLCGVVNVKLYDGNTCIYTGIGNRAGVEVVNL